MSLTPQEKQQFLNSCKQANQQTYSSSFSIATFGSSGCGKSVALTAMMATLLKNNIVQIDLEESKKREIQSNYQQLCETGQVPPTTAFSQWSFGVFSNERRTHLLDCTIYDYRGGSSELQNFLSNQTKDFDQGFNFLCSSSAVFVFADAKEFHCNKERVLLNLNFIRETIQLSLNKVPRTLQVILILTKVDTVGITSTLGVRNWDITALQHLCSEVFSKTFLPLKNNNKSVNIDMLPVSALGMSKFDNAGRISWRFRKKPKDLQSFQVTAPLLLFFDMIFSFMSEQFPKEEKLLLEQLKKNSEMKAAAHSSYLKTKLSPMTSYSVDRRKALQERKRTFLHYKSLCDMNRHSLDALKRKNKVIASITSSCGLIHKVSL